MGLTDFIRAGSIKSENENIKKELERLQSIQYTVEQLAYLDLKDETERLKNENAHLRLEIEKLNEEITELNQQIVLKKKQIIDLDEESLLQSFGLYQPTYNFANSKEYKERLDEIRAKQKQAIKNKTAVDYSKQWTVDGSKKEGERMTNDNINWQLGLPIMSAMRPFTKLNSTILSQLRKEFAVLSTRLIN
jgi:chromosome segregation ATPase